LKATNAFKHHRIRTHPHTLDPLTQTPLTFSGAVRSEARYAASLDANATRGTGIVATLSLMGKFERGELKHLQFYNLTCNECGGVGSGKCLAWSDCALPDDKCPCGGVGGAAAAAGNATVSGNSTEAAPTAAAGVQSRRWLQQEQQQQEQQQQEQQQRPTELHNATATTTGATISGNSGGEEHSTACDAAQMAACVTAVNLAYDGVDANGAALATAAQVCVLFCFNVVLHLALVASCEDSC
jgi:hypothetical protein